MLNPGQRVQYVAYATPDIRETPTTIQMDLFFIEEILWKPPQDLPGSHFLQCSVGIRLVLVND